MSHFIVSVIGPKTQPELEAALQPFHEYECTGVRDQYVIEVDKTEEARQEYEAHTDFGMKGPDGVLHYLFTPEGAYEERFSQPDPKAPDWDPTRRITFVPDGFEEVKIPVSKRQTFAQFAEDYYGAPIVKAGETNEGERRTEVDENGDVVRVINVTNPNKKWDWWVVGGRYAERILLKTGKQVDQAKIGQIDFAGMRAEAEKDAGETYDKYRAIIDSNPEFLSWEEALEKHRIGPGEHDFDIPAARETYNPQPAVKAYAAAAGAAGFWTKLEDYRIPREEFVKRAGDSSFTTFAVLKDGEWFERGRMGWWAMVSDEKDEDDWNREFLTLLQGLDPETTITMVDCHI